MFVTFCCAYTLPHEHRVCAVLFSRFPFKKFVRLCLSRFVIRTLPHKHRVCECFSLGLPYFKRVMFVTFCYTYFPSQTSGLCRYFPSATVKSVRLSLSCYVMRTSPHKHRFRAVLFSRLPFKLTRKNISNFCRISAFEFGQEQT